MTTQVGTLETYTATNTLSNSPVGKIIVVDDEPKLKNVLVAALSGQGFEVTGCCSGREALAELRVKEFDLLLTDLKMPEMDGIALLEAAAAIDPHLIGIMMTGQGSIQTAVDAMKLGAFDYILKPFRLQNVMPVLTRAINTRRVRMENLQLRETVAIYGLCQTISFTLDPQTVLSRLADAALQQSDADEVSILLPTSDGKELYVAAVRGEKRERLLGERVPLQQSISSWVARERLPLILNGQVQDERFVALWPRAEIRSAVSIPMQVANKLAGIINLNVINRLRPFTLGQMKALTILASTAAAALESASLYKQVQEAEKNYRSIFENAVEGIFQSTLDGRFITVNPSMARILGYDSPEEVISTITDIASQLYVHPEFREKAIELQGERGLVQGFEFEAYRKGGEKIWLSLNRRSFRDENGTEIYSEGSIEDITERKRAEAERLALFEVIQGLMTNRNLEELFKVIHKSIGKILYAENCFVGLYYEATRLMHFEYWADQFDPVPPPHPPGKGFSSYVLRTNQPLLLTDEIRSQMYASGEAEVRGRTSASWLGVPLSRHSRAMGVLVVQHYKDKNAYSQRDLEFLSSVGNQMALAIERKQAEEALTNSESEMRALFAAMTDVIFVLDADGRYLRIAPTDPTYLYDESVRLIGKTLHEVFPTGEADLFLKHIRRALAEGKTQRVEYHLEIAGKRVWFDGTVSPMSKDSVVWIAHDITERKRAEEQLRQSEERYRDLVENAHDLIYEHDLEGNYVSINKAVEHISGYSLEESIHLNLAQIVAPDYLKKAREMIRLKLAGEKVTAYELEIIAKDQSRVPLEVNSSLVLRNGVAVGVRGIARDITERKLSEKALRDSEERYRLLFDSNPQPMWVYDLDTLAFLAVNQSAVKNYGYSRDEFLSMTIKDIRPPEDLSALYETVSFSADGVGIAGRWRHLKKDGTLIEVEITCHLLVFDGRQAELILANDVTERNRLEAALLATEEQLRQSQKLEAIGQLAGGVAHDFNNLLTVIGGYSSILLNKLDQESPLRLSVEEIKKASDRAAGLTRQLLAFSRKQILQPKILDLNVVVSDLEKMVRRLIGEDIDLLAITDPKLGQVKADPGQLEQVLLNLIVNARDAMPSGGKLTIETANAILSPDYALSHGTPDGPYVMLAVSDTGCGMDTELQKHVFEPFFTTKVPGKGTGLGLATVYGIVKQSEGHIWLYSEIAKGTCFKIYLPRVDEVQADRVNTGGLKPVPKGTETLLLVEDEQQVRQIVKAILEQQGYDVLEAANGEEALKLAETHGSRLHLLMTDLVMPQMSGRELAEQLTSTLPNLKVLYMSGYTDDAIVRHGLLDASLSFIQKPFDAATAARKVREVLDSTVQ